MNRYSKTCTYQFDHSRLANGFALTQLKSLFSNEYLHIKLCTRYGDLINFPKINDYT